MMNNVYENLSEKLDNLHNEVEDIKDSDLFRKLNSLQGEIEGIKEYLLADKYQSETDKLMENADETYRKNLSESLISFIQDLDLEEIGDIDNSSVRSGVVEEPKVISDKFRIKLKTEFSESEFIDEWKSGEIAEGSYKFTMNYLPNDESIDLYLTRSKMYSKLKDGSVTENEITFLIDENELKSLEFMRTLFKRSEFWELQVVRKSDLKFELTEFGEEEVKTEIEFETIKFK